LLGYIFKRVLLMLPTLLGILVLSFFVIRLAPGDPASQKFGGSGQAQAGMNAERGTEAAELRFRKRFHFDEPLVVQFGYFLDRLWRGDMIFFQTEEPIWDDFNRALKITVGLNLIVFLLIYAISIPTGIFSAAFPHSGGDKLLTVVLFMLYSLPSFWVAELLRSWVMASGLSLPIMNLKSDNFEQLGSWERFTDYVRHIVMPVACMTYGGLAYLSRQMRAGMLEVIRQDYIRTAEAKGCSKPRVILVHALRNGLFPMITLLAALLPALIGGSVIIEFVFNIPGMGLRAYENVLRREYDFVMVSLMLSAVLTLFGILLSDILYVVVNPRVSFEADK
jgi:peptide/nickel transport system permease protein